MGRGQLTACHHNQIPSHPIIPHWLGLAGGAVPWMGPSQVSRNWTWVWLSRMEGSSGFSELGGKRDVRASVAGPLLPGYSLASLIDI